MFLKHIGEAEMITLPKVSESSKVQDSRIVYRDKKNVDEKNK